MKKRENTTVNVYGEDIPTEQQLDMLLEEMYISYENWEAKKRTWLTLCFIGGTIFGYIIAVI